MIFLPGIQEVSRTVFTDPPPLLLRHLLMTFAVWRYVHGPFGCYLSQWIENQELSFYLHYFFVRPGTRLFPRVEAPTNTLHHLLKGSVSCQLHEGAQVTVSEQVSHFFHLPGGVAHRADFNGEPVISAHFNYHPVFLATVQYPVLQNLLAAKPGRDHGVHELPVTHSYLEQYLWKNLPETLQQERSPQAFLAEKGRELLRLYCRGLAALKQTQAVVTGIQFSQRELELSQAVKSLIEADLRVHYTVAQLARKTGWNAFSLKQVFPQVYGETPYQHLIHCRMTFGKHLVLSTRELVRTIALNCGYKQVHHFIRLYKKTYGVTPGVMRGRG